MIEAAPSLMDRTVTIKTTTTILNSIVFYQMLKASLNTSDLVVIGLFVVNIDYLSYH